MTRKWTVAIVLAAWLVVVMAPALWFDEARYNAYTGGLQAIGLVLALGIAIWTLMRASVLKMWTGCWHGMPN